MTMGNEARIAWDFIPWNACPKCWEKMHQGSNRFVKLKRSSGVMRCPECGFTKDFEPGTNPLEEEMRERRRKRIREDNNKYMKDQPQVESVACKRKGGIDKEEIESIRKKATGKKCLVQE